MPAERWGGASCLANHDCTSGNWIMADNHQATNQSVSFHSLITTILDQPKRSFHGQ